MEPDGSSDPEPPMALTRIIHVLILYVYKNKSQLPWAELRVVWFLIAHKPWPLTLYTDNWAILKGLTLWLGLWELEGG